MAVHANGFDRTFIGLSHSDKAAVHERSVNPVEAKYMKEFEDFLAHAFAQIA